MGPLFALSRDSPHNLDPLDHCTRLESYSSKAAYSYTIVQHLSCQLCTANTYSRIAKLTFRTLRNVLARCFPAIISGNIYLPNLAHQLLPHRQVLLPHRCTRSYPEHEYGSTHTNIRTLYTLPDLLCLESKKADKVEYHIGPATLPQVHLGQLSIQSGWLRTYANRENWPASKPIGSLDAKRPKLAS